MMNQNNIPLITILIGCYNHEKYIVECLTTLLNLKLEKKILIIDDCSTDNTVKVVNKFISEHSDTNIELIQKESNSGVVSSINLGLSKMESKYFYPVASDDIPKVEGIKKVVEYLEQHENIDFFIGGGENFFENGEKTKVYTKKHRDFFSLDFRKRYEKIFLDYPSPLLLQSTVFKTQILKNVGGWDKDLIWDDYPMFVKLLGNKNINFVFDPSIETVFYRHHGLNTYKNIQKQYKMILQAMNKLAPSHLKNQALGNALGYYILKALQQFDFKVLLRLLYLSPTFSYPYAVQKMFSIIIKKIVRRT
ncbi:glycosyltransferase family 2 protein [Arcobacter porcinus]|uniref:Glycosyltransferase EpsE n=1 Tax=Arcobacter porcinus TaxID=1935204 RepID=A0ABX2YD66_9BACT|nr:glycosyltransferase family 2 protein [Arcobacter porcinus]OCL92935.1 putative glycosyltransferase EpsE [Arcobacter porcinus]